MPCFVVLILILPALINASLPGDIIFGVNETTPAPTIDPLVYAESVCGNSSRRHLDFVATAKFDGFDVTTHDVTTIDGYILRVFRMKKLLICEGVDRPEPVVWMHGLFMSADTCNLKGKDSQCYEFVRNCFDLWIPNMRGNKYSRNHTTLNPDKDMQFWNFDFDEMAKIDLATVIDYVLKETNKTQVIYVAHSQGVTLMMILCALFPEYNHKVKTGYGMSSATWLDDSGIFILDVEALLASGIAIGSALGVHYEVIKHGGPLSILADFFCGTTSATYYLCSCFVFAFFGYNKFQITPCVLIDTVGHEPSGASIDLFGRWGAVRSYGFRQKCGILGNTPINGWDCPEYSLQNVIMKWVFLSCVNDVVSSRKDMNTLKSRLVNCEYIECLLRDLFFGHIDFVLGKNSKLYCSDFIIPHIITGSTSSCQGEIIKSPLIKEDTL